MKIKKILIKFLVSKYLIIVEFKLYTRLKFSYLPKSKYLIIVEFKCRTEYNFIIFFFCKYLIIVEFKFNFCKTFLPAAFVNI